jgi:hypothetical protein
MWKNFDSQLSYLIEKKSPEDNQHSPGEWSLVRTTTWLINETFCTRCSDKSKVKPEGYQIQCIIQVSKPIKITDNISFIAEHK